MPSDVNDHELQKLHGRSLEEDAEEERREPAMPHSQRDHHDAERDTAAATPLIERISQRDGDKDLNHRTVRKLDTILLPFLAILFLLNSLDKSNIGNAETAGFTHDTGLSRGDVNTSMAVFFFVFVLLQPVGAGLGRRFGMKRYVPACMSLWGVSTVLHIFVRKRWHLILLRIMIATLESGFYPTTVSYMSLFYTKYEFAFRLGFFYGMTAVSGMLGGVLSWAVFSQFPGDGAEPSPPTARAGEGEWKSWEILFLIEGCMTMTIALIGFLWLPRSAETAWFLKADERRWAERRMLLDAHENRRTDEQRIDNEPTSPRAVPEDEDGMLEIGDARDEDGRSEVHDRLLAGNELHESLRKSAPGQAITEDSGLTRQDILSAVFNYKIWHLLIVNILSAIPATAFGVLLPILVKELSPSLNLSPAASNLLSAPPFACGAILLLIFTIWSDRSRQRLIPILCSLAILLSGLAMAIISPVDDYFFRYLALCVVLSGSFIASPLTVAWLANNTPEPGKRAILLGINGWGNLAGCFMPVLFTPKGERNGYAGSFVALLVSSLVAFMGFVAFRLLLVRENKFRNDVLRGWSAEEKQREEVSGDMPAPSFHTRGFIERLGLVKWARRLGLEDARKGDEKLTYRYSL